MLLSKFKKLFTLIKYEYKVVKTFGIFSDDVGKRLAANDDELNHSSRFGLDTMYVDYKFPNEDLDQDSLTEFLIEEGYIQLIKEIKG